MSDEKEEESAKTDVYPACRWDGGGDEGHRAQLDNGSSLIIVRDKKSLRVRVKVKVRTRVMIQCAPQRP